MHMIGLEMTGGDLVIFVALVMFLAAAAGVVFDGIMGIHGFGILGNAIVVTCGGVLALYFDATILRHGTQIEFRNAFISCGATATAVLLALALAKKRIVTWV